MGFEVALLEWSGANRGEGVRLVGRSSAPELVEVVREHLLAEATEELGDANEDKPKLTLISKPLDENEDPDEGGR